MSTKNIRQSLHGESHLFHTIRHSNRELLLFLLVLVLFVLFETFVMNGKYVTDRLKGLEERRYEISDGAFVDFQEQQGALLALTDDPNITLENLNIPVEVVVLDQCTNRVAGAIGQVFYRRAGEDYGEPQSILYAADLDVDQLALGLPSTLEVASLRLDLTNKKGDLVTCEEFVLNPATEPNFSILRVLFYLLPFSFAALYIFRDTGPGSLLLRGVERKTSLRIDQNVVGNIFAGSWFVLLGVRALTTLDKSFDSLVYHVPFAARSAGIFPKSGYLFEYNLEYVYEGFPILIELLQGVLWKLSGWVTATNLVGWSFLLLLVLFTCRRLDLPFWQLSLFVSSIPLVITHSSSSDVDLPVACLFSLAFVNFIHAVLKEDYSPASLAFILLPLAIGTNVKFTLVAPAALLALITLILFLAKLRGQGREALWKRLRSYLMVVSVLAVVGGITLIKNLVIYQNPFYPLDFSFWFIEFDGPFAPDGGVVDSVANPLANLGYYLFSLSEVYLWNTSTDFGWTVDMYNIYQGNPIRYGGYFIANILFWGACILILLRRNNDPRQRLIASILLLFWIFVGFLPESFELRYNMYLPILTAICVLVFLRSEPPGSHPERKLYRFLHVFQIAIFTFVILSIPHYIAPSRDYKKINTATYGFNDPRYQLSNVNGPACLTGEIPYTFLYKLQNPQLELQAAYSEETCIYPHLELE